MKTILLSLFLLLGLSTTLTSCGFPGGNAEQKEQSEERGTETRFSEEEKTQTDDDDDDDQQGEKSREPRSERHDRNGQDDD
ncbi:MAG TPA: hypothetical protein V6C64_01645 [Microcoleaceae cyanobacterium]|jgi:hypothetical protein